MLPSKAERILSRYRPIAPKPLPLPPSGSFGTTDPSSTCASLDSFTSSAKCKKSRKRKADDIISAKGLKSSKPIGSAPSNTGGASSLTQGVSDGTVPRGDLRSASQISYGSRPFGMEEGTEMSNGASKECRGMASEVRFAAYNGIVAPMYVADAGNMVHTPGLYIPPEASAQHQHQLSLIQQRLSPGGNPSSIGVMDKDSGFMARAAAASSSVLPDKSSVLACDVGCAKGVGYVGGGFTEMIRGITRLPTAADVQSLMQARASPSAAVGQPAVVAASSFAGLRSSPTCSRETSQRSPHLPTTTAQNWILKSPPGAEVDQACESDVDLVTLSLLPNVPSRMCASAVEPLQAGVPSALTPLHSYSHNLEPSWHHQVASRGVEPLTVLTSRHESQAVLASRSVGLSCTGAQLTTRYPPPSGLPKKAVGEMVAGLCSTVMQVAASSVMADGAVIDEGYLEQVYGGSTDPVLLVDDNHQALWFNKPYDRALKSASERISGKMVHSGPYIDPLGHPTPLGSFVFPLYGKPLRATLWGFLKKLVIQENEVPLEQGAPSSQLHLCVGEAYQRTSPLGVEPGNRMSPVVCSGIPRMTTVTLESVTELHMEAPATAECIEAAEARLAAGSEPAFITDCLSRVRWVNTVLKQMLCHMNFDGVSIHTDSCGKGANAPMSTAEAPGFIICCSEKVPRSAWAFSCRVNLEWLKGGRRRSMTVPCDVSRLACNTRASEASWAWQFDMAVSLGLHAPT